METYVKPFASLTVQELYEILKARAEVFFLEQKIVCQDLDDVDYEAIHVFIRQGKKVCAYLRIYEKSEDTVQIGRVLSTERGVGLGKAVMEAGIKACRSLPGKKTLRIEAQSYAIGFYEKLGFTVTSEEFLDVGIPHVEMILDL